MFIIRSSVHPSIHPTIHISIQSLCATIGLSICILYIITNCACITYIHMCIPVMLPMCQDRRWIERFRLNDITDEQILIDCYKKICRTNLPRSIIRSNWLSPVNYWLRSHYATELKQTYVHVLKGKKTWILSLENAANSLAATNHEHKSSPAI